jgi:hypothetical protein
MAIHRPLERNTKINGGSLIAPTDGCRYTRRHFVVQQGYSRDALEGPNGNSVNSLLQLHWSHFPFSLPVLLTFME